MSIARVRPKGYIPEEIRPLVEERHILSSENPEIYDQVLKLLMARYQPRDVVGWLAVKNLQDLMWEQLRLSRFKPAIIESAWKKALVSILIEIGNTSVWDEDNVEQSEEDATRWFIDESARKRILDLLKQFNLSPAIVDAKAFTLHAGELQITENMQTSNEARQCGLRRYLEEQLSIDSKNSNAGTFDKKSA